MQVLLWLKQWDSLVFGSHLRATSDDVLSALRMHSSVTQSSKFASNRRFFSKHHSGVSSNDQNVRSPIETSKSNGPHASWSNKCLVDKPPEQKVGDSKNHSIMFLFCLYPTKQFSALLLSLTTMSNFGLTSTSSVVVLNVPVSHEIEC